MDKYDQLKRAVLAIAAKMKANKGETMFTRPCADEWNSLKAVSADELRDYAQEIEEIIENMEVEE